MARYRCRGGRRLPVSSHLAGRLVENLFVVTSADWRAFFLGGAYTAPVRKRLVIGAIAAVVIGVAAYVLSQPRKGTVEWHRRGYLRAVEQVFEESLLERVTHIVENVAGIPLSGDGQEEAFNQHMRFLVTTGFS